MKYQMYLVLGDWSDDGHGKYDKILVETNYPVDKVQQAYKDSCKLTGVEFNHNESYTGIERKWDEREKYSIADSYQDNRLTPEVIEVLSKYDGFAELELDEYIYQEEYIKLWFWFVKLSLPALVYTQQDENSKIPCINGYWDKNLNVQFGYGLYD